MPNCEANKVPQNIDNLGDKRSAGRPKGSPNKITALLKDAILKAGGEDGMVGYLRSQAKENPGPFMALLGKVLPMQIEGNGESVEITFQTIYATKH